MTFLGKFGKVQSTSTTTLATLGTLAMGLLVSGMASAQGFSGLFNGVLTEQLFAGADFMSAIAYLAGIGFGIKAALKLKEWNDSKGREATLTQALIPLVIAGMLLGLPTVLKIARESATGNQLTGTGITGGGVIRNIN